ncbi:MAG: hypothetical protein RIC35_15170 [Marinoscillum sp.]
MKLNLSLLGAVGGTIAIMFTYSLKVMYPAGAIGFLQMYVTSMIIVGFLSWIIWRKVSPESILIKVGFSILAIATLCSLVAGINYSFIQKTEEFLIYFLLVTLTSIACWVEIIRQMASFNKSANVMGLIVGLGIGLALASVFSPLVNWLVVLVLLLAYGYLSINSRLAFK